MDNFELDDRIVLFGMSCSGKTTFAKKLSNHKYYCFDYLFKWHLVESFGLSISKNLSHIKKTCKDKKFVLDGWHLSDKDGLYLPDNVSVYVIWAPYEKIISQYRVQVYDPEEHRHMYNKWYCEIKYDKLPSVKYFKNFGNFEQIDKNQFDFLKTKSTKSKDI